MESGPSASEIRAGARGALARAITLLESARSDRAAEGRRLLEALMPNTGTAVRVGVTGPPGVGKSTFIEALGLHLIEQGLQVAVLAVDPSSPITHGSILGDKTRMERLARRPEAFIRPSPSGSALGGVAHRTRETLLVCEAAGFDVVLVETVGIGQSEVAVRSMVDFFLVLLQPGSGDELQGIKKGVIELADGLVVNKADGEQRMAADRTRSSHKNALGLLRPLSSNWAPDVLQVSSLESEGIADVWQMVMSHREALEASGEMQERRCDQARAWLWDLVDDGLRDAFQSSPGVVSRLDETLRAVSDLRTPAPVAAAELLQIFRGV